jgi:hypothetical protein
MIWSMACIAKFQVMNSTMGLRPPSELGEQALRHLVGALIFGDFLAHDEHALVGAHLLGHGVAQGLAHGDGGRLGARTDFRLDHGRRAFGARRWARGDEGLRLLFLRRGRCWRSDGALHGSGILAIGDQHRDRRIHLHALRARRHEDLAEPAFIHRFDLHGRLICLDLGNDIARRDFVAFRFQPFGELAFLHGRRQRRHQDLHGHCLYCSWARRVLASVLFEDRKPSSPVPSLGGDLSKIAARGKVGFAGYHRRLHETPGFVKPGSAW